MNRVLMVAAVLVLTVAGCAADVDDPTVPPVEETQQETPSKALSGDAQRTRGTDVVVDDTRLGGLGSLGNGVPIPGPIPSE